MHGRLLKEKTVEAARAVVPLTLLVAVIDAALGRFTGSGMPRGTLLQFLIGAALILVGVTALALGEELAMAHMGELIGAHLTGTGKYLLLVICCFLMGALVTLAEPNLHVFASLVPGVADRTVVYAAACGAGVFMVLGVMRVQRRIPLPVALTITYALLAAASAAAPKLSFALAFDSGGVATGPVTVAFIASVGVGIASVRGGRSSADDSFGTLAMCAAGPVFALLLLGILRSDGAVPEVSLHHTAEGARIIADYLHEIPVIFAEVAVALAPILVFFTLFQFIFLKIHARGLLRIGVGVVSAFVGHTLFLAGAFVGFLPAGHYLGGAIAGLPGGLKWLLIPAAMLMGGLTVTAEPGVHILSHQVEEVTVGALNGRAIKAVAVVSTAAAAGWAMFRVLTGVPLWYFLAAGYALSLTLSFLVPRMFTAIAFDSGVMTTGAMIAAFLLPFVKGAGEALSDSPGTVLTDAFGLVALAVMMPAVAIQTLGLVYKLKMTGTPILTRAEESEVTVIEYDREEAA